jgi:hypothetical protein
LAKRYGFGDLDGLIADIPQGATVLDVGAGMSLFGHAVASRRPDITWVNIDPFYTDEQVALAKTDAPKNVRYIADDITNPAAKTRELCAQRIYSYWMLPHLSLTGDGPANRAVGTMWDLLTEGGQMYLGPDRPYHFLSNFRTARLVHVSKTPRHEVITRVVAITRLPLYMRVVQNRVNRHLRGVADSVLQRLMASQMRRARSTISKP